MPRCNCGAEMHSDGVQETATGRFEFFICESCGAEARKPASAPVVQANPDGLVFEEQW